VGEALGYYLILLLVVQPIDEFYTCNNPNTISEDSLHILCDWEDADFITLKNGNRVLRPKRKKDNLIKAHYRRKYWDAKQESKAKEVGSQKKARSH
jgi:hypothetical protein